MNTATSRQQMKLQALAVVVGVGVMGLKFVAYFLTHSNAVLTDALESIINVVAGAFALYSLYLASKPRDNDHPYGHGKVEFLSAGFEGALIVFAGLAMIWKAIYNFFNPEPIGHLDVGIILIVISGIINYALGYGLEKKGNETNSLTLKADGRHLKLDAYSSVLILIGLTVIYFTKIAVLDNVFALAFALFIIYSGFKLFRESLAGIMDEADILLIQEIVAILEKNRTPNWMDVHNMRVIKYGSTYHVDCHVTLPWYFELQEAHSEMEKIAKLVSDNMGNEVEFFIHPDPCQPTSCKLCMKEDCPVRQEAFKERITWTLENVSRNKKHGL